jgi:hypothetical protein
MTRIPTSTNEAAPGAGTAGAAQEPAAIPQAEDRAVVVAEAVQVFRSIGVTAGDLRAWAPWCPVLGEMADAMDESQAVAGAA